MRVSLRLSLHPGLLGMVLLTGLQSALADDISENLITNLPAEAKPISEYFYTGQSVYDADGAEVGDVNDVLLGTNGRVAAVIVGVGGFLGSGEKNLAFTFGAFEVVEKDLKSHLVLNVPKEALETAPGFQFDRAKRRWLPAPARLIDGEAKEN